MIRSWGRARILEGLALLLGLEGCHPAGSEGRSQAVEDEVVISGGKEVQGFARGSTDLIIAGNVVRYNGYDLRLFDRLDIWLAALGQPSRTTTKDHSIVGPTRKSIWDDLGITCGAVTTPDDRAYVFEVDVLLVANDKPEYDFRLPRHAFSGRVILEHALLKNGWNNITEVLRDMRGLPPLHYCEERWWWGLLGLSNPMSSFGFEAPRQPDGPTLDISMDLEVVPGGQHCDRRFRSLTLGSLTPESQPLALSSRREPWL
ncbi:hypothetical protein [Pendulispora albinea]|uniref:DUF7738 domain-containing protein n=1 Tax=Pendulispora albinea TaxID=2741071 RepID=A0ABZ2LN57_9BACT